MRRRISLKLLSLAALAVGSLPATAQTTAPAMPKTASDWRDWPVTPGTWAYRQDARGSIALFGRTGEDADFTIRCDRQRATVYISRRADVAPGPVAISLRTTSQARSLTAQPTGGTPLYIAIELGVRDPLLDAMGFSRGRFLVEGGGMPTLVVPAWAEILRVTEDCRG